MAHTTSTSLDIAPAPPQTHADLTVFPLVSMAAVELPYRLLVDALADGSLEVREVDESGSVPELLVTNRGQTDVLILDGEQLLGAKQNRMAGRTLLLPPEGTTRIPVSCIERGRWRFKSGSFGSSGKHSPSRTRKSVRSLEARLAKEGVAVEPGQLREAQGEVWREVENYSLALGVRSPTSALDEVYDAAGARLEDWIPRFPPLERQVGLLAFDRERPLGLDVIGGHELYARLHERLLRGYALDALEGRRVRARAGGRRRSDVGASSSSEVDESSALRFLAEVQRATRTPAPTVGRGIYRVLSETVVGGELVDGARLAHRSAFEAE